MKLHPIHERSKCFVCEEIVYKSQKSVKIDIGGEMKLFHKVPCYEQVMKIMKQKEKEKK